MRGAHDADSHEWLNPVVVREATLPVRQRQRDGVAAVCGGRAAQRGAGRAAHGYRKIIAWQKILARKNRGETP